MRESDYNRESGNYRSGSKFSKTISALDTILMSSMAVASGIKAARAGNGSRSGLLLLTYDEMGRQQWFFPSDAQEWKKELFALTSFDVYSRVKYHDKVWVSKGQRLSDDLDIGVRNPVLTHRQVVSCFMSDGESLVDVPSAPLHADGYLVVMTGEYGREVRVDV